LCRNSFVCNCVMSSPKPFNKWITRHLCHRLCASARIVYTLLSLYLSIK
jgi:hypothetical protein